MTGIFVALSLAGSAQGANQPVTIDLEQAIRIALSENPTIRIADLEIERQDYVRKETWGNLIPALSGSVDYSNAIKQTTMDFGGNKVSLQPDNTITFGAAVTLPLFVPGVYQSLKLNREQMRAAVEGARGSRITMTCEVRKAFYNVLRIEQEIAVLRTTQTTTTQTVEDIRTKLANGMASEYDLLTAEVQLSNLTPTILQAEQGLQVARMYLKMLMGMPLDQQVAFRGDLREMERSMADMPSDYDLNGNSDLRSLEIQENILERQLKVMRTQRMPSLGAQFSGSISGMGRTSISFDPSVPPRNVFDWQQPVNFGASLKIPIFAGLTNANREKQLRNNISQLDARRQYTEQQLAVQAKTAAGDVRTAREKMAATAKTVEQARKAYDIANVRYKAGTGTILELNTAQLQLTQAQLNNAQAVYALLAAQADYQRILGNE